MNIYIGNIAYDVREDDLRSTLEQFGQVNSVNIIIDRESGRSKGFGFAEMGSQAEGEAVIANLNGTELNGRALNVNEARPREDNDRRGGGNRGGGGGRGYDRNRGGGNRGRDNRR